MASQKNLPLPDGDKASGLDGDPQARRSQEEGFGRRKREGLDSLERRRRTGGVWVVDVVILALIVAAVVGAVYLYRYLRDTYAPVWREVPVVYTVELNGIDPELIAYDKNGDIALIGKDIFGSGQEDADRLGTVTDATLLRTAEEGQPDTVTVFLTVEATARYREEKGYWMTDTRLLCGEERSFRMAGLDAKGIIISLHEAAELETAPEAGSSVRSDGGQP